MNIFSDILGLVISAVSHLIFYFTDAKREEKGLPTKHREFLGSLSGGGMDFLEFYRSDLKKIKSKTEQFENDKRLKYVYKDNNAAMDNIAAIGSIESKTTENSNKMESI